MKNTLQLSVVTDNSYSHTQRATYNRENRFEANLLNINNMLYCTVDE